MLEIKPNVLVNFWIICLITWLILNKFLLLNI